MHTPSSVACHTTSSRRLRALGDCRAWSAFDAMVEMNGRCCFGCVRMPFRHRPAPLPGTTAAAGGGAPAGRHSTHNQPAISAGDHAICAPAAIQNSC